MTMIEGGGGWVIKASSSPLGKKYLEGKRVLQSAPQNRRALRALGGSDMFPGVAWRTAACPAIHPETNYLHQNILPNSLKVKYGTGWPGNLVE